MKSLLRQGLTGTNQSAYLLYLGDQLLTMNKKKHFQTKVLKQCQKKKLFTDEKRLCKRVRCVQALPCVDMLGTGTRHPLQGHAHARLRGEREKERKRILYNVSELCPKRVYHFTFTLTQKKEQSRTEQEG